MTTSPASNRSRRVRRRVLSVASILLATSASLYFYFELRYSGFEGLPKTAATDAKISQLSAALLSYETNCGSLPTEEQGLKVLVKLPTDPPPPERWVKIAQEHDLLDAWKIPFAYYNPARNGTGEFEFVSAGPDKKMNTEDDLSSVKPE